MSHRRLAGLRLDRAAVEALLADGATPESEKGWLRDELRAYDELLEANPLQGFVPHSEPQRAFLAATTPVQAAFAGNRFGKTTALVVKCLVQHAPAGLLPEGLRQFRRTEVGRPTMGRLLVPSEQAFIEYTIPAFKRWCPKALFRGGSWDAAYDKQHRILYFAEGCGQLGVYTYKQDPATMVGAQLDYVGYDEPPPEALRRESLIRLVDRDGFEMFALTPVNMQGSGIGWLYRQVWKRRESPDVTVVQASIHDNPLLSRSAVERVLAEYPEDERRARELGEFVHFGGMVFPGGFEGVLVDEPPADHVHGLDVVVGLDPGLKNAAFTWHGFDQDNRCLVFDELLVQEGVPGDYVVGIALKNARWGLSDERVRRSALEVLKQRRVAGRLSDAEFGSKSGQLQKPGAGPEPLYVIDPSAKNRSLEGGESVEAVLQSLGLYPMRGMNDVQAGVQQMRDRVAQGGYRVSRECRGLRGEADEYRMEDRQDGEFKVVKENDHRLDSSRYATTTRLWNPVLELERARDDLGYQPGVAPPLRDLLAGPGPQAPMGSMS